MSQYVLYHTWRGIGIYNHAAFDVKDKCPSPNVPQSYLT